MLSYKYIIFGLIVGYFFQLILLQQKIIIINTNFKKNTKCNKMIL